MDDRAVLNERTESAVPLISLNNLNDSNHPNNNGNNGNNGNAAGNGANKEEERDADGHTAASRLACEFGQIITEFLNLYFIQFSLLFLCLSSPHPAPHHLTIRLNMRSTT